MRFTIHLHGLLTLLIVATLLTGADTLERDQWFVGKLNDTPAISMHVTTLRHDDGTRTSTMDMRILISRALGDQALNMEIAQAHSFVEDADGTIRRFRIEEDMNGNKTLAVGSVVGNELVATIHRLGRADKQTATIPEGMQLLGEQASQDLMAKKLSKPGDSLRFVQPVLMSNRLLASTSTATVRAVQPNGDLDIDAVSDLAPTLAMQMRLAPNGDLRRMTMDLMIFKIEVVPSPGPVALRAAEIAPTGMAKAAGPAPAWGPTNRFRLPAAVLAAIGDDGFQRRDGDTVTVSSIAVAAPLADPLPYLAREPQLEIDDPALRAWVDGIVQLGGNETPSDLAERLRVAVRSHITTKDLSKADGTALETFRDRRGDCTEHANLLCAVLRIAGIPARCEVGAVYAADYGGWVGHAWNAAYIDDRWVHLDAAYPGIPRSCYVRLGFTGGSNAASTGAAMVTAITGLYGQTIETITP